MEATGVNKTYTRGTKEVPNQFLSIIKSAFLFTFFHVIEIIMLPIVLVKFLWTYKKETKKEK